MPGRGGFHWDGMDIMQSNVAGMDEKVQRAIVAGANYAAPQIESWMKTNAPWTDRTGNARNGLTARASGGGGGRDAAGRFVSGGGAGPSSGKGASITLSYSVPYGIWLEVRFGGRYGIIAPAIEMWADRTLDIIGQFVSREMGP